MFQLGTPYLLFLACVTLQGLTTACIRFGVAWYALGETGSAAAFAAMIGVATLFEVFSKPLLAPLADHFDRVKVFRVSLLLSVLCAGALAAAVLWWPFSAPLLTGLLIAQGLVAGLRDPNTASLVPSLVPPALLTQAQSARAGATSVANIGGPVVAGAVLALLGVPATLLAACALLLVALLCALPMVAHEPLLAAGAGPDSGFGRFVRSWHHRTVDGLRSVWANDAERKTAIATALMNAGLFPFGAVVLPVWVMQDLGGSAADMAVLEASLAVGVLLGSFVLIGRVNTWFGRYGAVLLGTLLAGGALLAASMLTRLPAIVPCLLVGGAGVSFFLINTVTLRSIATPAAFRARSMAGSGFLSQCIHPFAIQGYGVLMAAFGARVAVAVCGLAVLSAMGLLLSNRGARALMARPNEDIVGAYGQMFPRAFAEGDRHG